MSLLIGTALLSAGMTSLMMANRPRVKLRLLAAAVAAAAQILLAAAPLAEASFGPDSSAHVEVAGTDLHHGHDEATCAACVSQHLVAASEPVRSARYGSLASASRLHAAVLRADSQSPQFFTKSRAPPATPV